MRIQFIFLWLTAVIYLTSATKVPFITRCKWDDEKCIKDSTQAAIPPVAEGIPELGVHKMDPLSIDTIDASSPNLKLIVKKITVEGLKNCEAKKMSRDKANSKLFLDVLCSVKMVGDYDMDGKLLLLPITGNGEMRVVLPNIFLQVEVDLDVKKGKDGEDHWNIKKWKHVFELQGKSTIEFDNLFGGNKVLGKAVTDTIAGHSNEVILEIGQGLIKSVIGTVAHNCNALFRAVTLKDLVLS